MKPAARLLIATVAAAAAPTASKAADHDGRIASRIFDATAIVSLHGRSGIQSTVVFGDDERIENVAVGDSDAWQVTPNKRADLLFVKPMNAHARTNMTVVTDQHTYLFDLVATPGAAPVYMLRFTYPDRPKPAPQPVLAAPTPKPAPATPPAVALPQLDPAALNFAWEAKGDKALLPSRSFDDGRRIYLAWPKDAGLPAILTRSPAGIEGPVNYMVHGDYVVVDGVPPQLVLRLGKQIATLTQLHAISPPAPPLSVSSPSPAATADAESLARTASAQP